MIIKNKFKNNLLLPMPPFALSLMSLLSLVWLVWFLSIFICFENVSTASEQPKLIGDTAKDTNKLSCSQRDDFLKGEKGEKEELNKNLLRIRESEVLSATIEKLQKDFNTTISGEEKEMISGFVHKFIFDYSKVMLGKVASDENMKAFFHMFFKLIRGEKALISGDDYQQLAINEMLNLKEINSEEKKRLKKIGEKLLKEGNVVFANLNGGLGTSMGCEGPKSVMEVKNKKSFLDLRIEQIKAISKKVGGDSKSSNLLPFALMNSFNTTEDTNRALKGKISHDDFEQNMFPRILVTKKGDKTFYSPFKSEVRDADEWNPPGHGDFYAAAYGSGWLDELKKKGVKYIFMANADNLGAIPDSVIVGYIADKRVQILTEVTEKSKADVKGGGFGRSLRSGRIMNIEVAQVSDKNPKDMKKFESMPSFNTNNMIMEVDALIERMSKEGVRTSMIVNPKIVEGKQVIQLESAIASAIEGFERSVVALVPRDRFLPVKKIGDMIALSSDLFVIAEDGVPRLNPAREVGGGLNDIKIDFGDWKLKDAKESIKGNISLLNAKNVGVKCKNLVIENGVSFANDVVIEQEDSRPVHIVAGTKLDGVVIKTKSISNSKIIDGKIKVEVFEDESGKIVIQNISKSK
ncbi:MAG: UTP--glucose-1-phosphate uridylyltransferase [Oligoflexia bacterium]|nr:UTP--glucose-1-phosphate uridylyltransferase [Oligoflexia bacterium]